MNTNKTTTLLDGNTLLYLVWRHSNLINFQCLPKAIDNVYEAVYKLRNFSSIGVPIIDTIILDYVRLAKTKCYTYDQDLSLKGKLKISEDLICIYFNITNDIDQTDFEKLLMKNFIENAYMLNYKDNKHKTLEQWVEYAYSTLN